MDTNVLTHDVLLQTTNIVSVMIFLPTGYMFIILLSAIISTHTKKRTQRAIYEAIVHSIIQFLYRRLPVFKTSDISTIMQHR